LKEIGMGGRRADPNRNLELFLSDIRLSLDRYRRLEAALEAAGEDNPIRKGVAEDAAFRLGVLWETFQADWYLAAISRDPTAFVDKMKGRLGEAVVDKWAKTVIESFTPGALTIPKNPTVAQIVTMLDRKGLNVTFEDVTAWKKHADSHLGAAHRARVNAIASNTEASSLLWYLKKLRNLHAHGSDNGKEEFNKAARSRGPKEKIGLVGERNRPLQRASREVSDIGRFLRAKTADELRRVELLHTRVADVANMLRTS
jgi:hypothetical protein